MFAFAIVIAAALIGLRFIKPGIDQEKAKEEQEMEELYFDRDEDQPTSEDEANLAAETNAEITITEPETEAYTLADIENIDLNTYQGYDEVLKVTSELGDSESHKIKMEVLEDIRNLINEDEYISQYYSGNDIKIRENDAKNAEVYLDGATELGYDHDRITLMVLDPTSDYYESDDLLRFRAFLERKDKLGENGFTVPAELMNKNLILKAFYDTQSVADQSIEVYIEKDNKYYECFPLYQGYDYVDGLSVEPGHYKAQFRVPYDMNADYRIEPSEIEFDIKGDAGEQKVITLQLITDKDPTWIAQGRRWDDDAAEWEREHNFLTQHGYESFKLAEMDKLGIDDSEYYNNDEAENEANIVIQRENDDTTGASEETTEAQVEATNPEASEEQEVEIFSGAKPN